MAVNPLDPTKPTLLDQSIELTEELRAIKTRLVTDKTNIETLQNTLINISGITEFGAELLASPNPSAALDTLDFTETGKDISQLPDLETLASALGVVNPAPSLSVGVSKWCIQFAGSGLKINMVKFTIPGGAAADLTWQTAFTVGVYGISYGLATSSDDPIYSVGDPTLTGVSLRCNTTNPRNGYVIAIGQ